MWILHRLLNGGEPMAYVPVPKDLTKVKTKVAFNLTGRQLIYLLTKGILGADVSAILMVTIMLPFFFLAMYEKDGLPFEKVAGNIIRQKFIYPPVRRYKTENFYAGVASLIEMEEADGKKDKKTAAGNAARPGRKKKPPGRKK